ncbi:hypothetical protein BCR42DRAFT_320725, partial [Absidia repens]
LAAVSFLETTNLVGLGLSADRVHSNVTDLNALTPVSPATTNSSILPGQTTAGGTGLKLVSDVMDSSYRVFDGIGRFWQQQRNGPDHYHSPSDEPIQKFLEMKTVDELKIGEVAELLADYKRLAAVLKQSNLR